MELVPLFPAEPGVNQFLTLADLKSRRRAGMIVMAYLKSSCRGRVNDFLSDWYGVVSI